MCKSYITDIGSIFGAGVTAKRGAQGGTLLPSTAWAILSEGEGRVNDTANPPIQSKIPCVARHER
jgi:hypothetical protein